MNLDKEARTFEGFIFAVYPTRGRKALKNSTTRLLNDCEMASCGDDEQMLFLHKAYSE